MKGLHSVSFILVIVGALNWGLVGLGGLIGNGSWNVVELLVGTGTLAIVVYLLVGLGAVYLVLTHKKDCRHCAVEAPQHAAGAM